MTGSGAGGLTVVVSPPPTPNGPLHVGHLAGPYVAADVAVRAARARGAAVVSVCGTDDHQNYVAAKAAEQGRGPDDVIADFGARITDVFDRALIRHDVFTRPRTDAAYQDAVAALVGEFTERGIFTVAAVPVLRCRPCDRTLHHAYVSGGCPHCGAGMGGGTCEGCGGFATAADLVSPRCTGCDTTPVRELLPSPMFRLEDHRSALTRMWARATLPPAVRPLVTRYLDAPLPDITVAYPSDWGLPVDGRRLDVWCEMGLAYLWAVGRYAGAASSGVADLTAAWRDVGRLWTFLGIDNAFYYAVLFPAMLHAVGVAPQACLGGLVVNEFYRLDGRKFSTSRNHAVWGHELLEAAKPGTVRAYLSLDRPAPYPSNFTMDDFTAFAGRWPAPPGTFPFAGAGDVDRAAHALRLETFDPALAIRCLAPAATTDGTAARLLAAVTGAGES